MGSLYEREQEGGWIHRKRWTGIEKKTKRESIYIYRSKKK